MKFKINAKAKAKVEKQFDEAWASVVAKLDLEMQAVIEDPNTFADLGFINQDIVDTGRFRDSQVVTVKDRVVTFTWNPRNPENGFAYAPALYSGFHAFGNKYIPGRKWPEKAVERLNVTESLRQEMQNRGVKAKAKIKKKVL